MKKQNLQQLKPKITLTALALALALAFALTLVLPKPAYAYMLYENPGRIILKAPGDNYTTAAAKVSILGACDWTKPLYLNGQPLEYTEHGFFAAYVSLAPGANSFTLSQGEGTGRTITITRRGSSSSGGSGGSGGFSWSGVKYYEEPLWGEVKSNNITHRRQADSSQELLNALAAGSSARIIGEYGSYYLLSDNSFIYKNNVRLIAAQDAAQISSITVTPRTAQNCTELNLKTTVNALYRVEMGEDQVKITLYDAQSSCRPVYADNPLFAEIRQTTDSAKNTLTLTLPLKPGAQVYGYYVEYREGYMVIGLKQPPQLSTADPRRDLTGAVVLLDAGHGGSDSGATGPPNTAGPMEKNINLVITNYAKAYLEARGATVVMTRTGDTELSLAGRVAKILETKPDLAISIHTNSIAETADYTATQGMRVYYTYDLARPACDFIAPRLSRYAGMNQTTPQRSNLALTRIENTPALLIENAFISSPEDYEMMIQSEYQQRFGEAIGQAAAEYLLSASSSSSSSYAVTTMAQATGSDPALRPITVYLDGQPLTFDVDPFIMNDTTLVPLRAIFEALDATVVWHNDTKDLDAKSADQTTRLYLALNSPEMQITYDSAPDGSSYSATPDARTVTLLAPATARGGRILVPLRAISEGLGCDVEWEAASRSVIIRSIQD